MAPGSLYICLVVVLAQINFMALGQTVTCRYADSILVNGTCFRYNSTLVTWPEGKAFCASMNGALAVVNSSAQITTALKNMAIYSDAWIGANDIDVEGTFIWDLDKSPIGTSLNGIWGIGQPNSFSATYDCCEIYRLSSSFKAYNSACTDLYGTLCMELPLPTTLSTTTTTTTTTTQTTTTTAPTTTTTTPTTTTTTPTTTTTAQTTTETPQMTTTATTGATTVTTTTTSATSLSTAQSTSTVQSDTSSTNTEASSTESTTPESSTTTSQETPPLSNIEPKPVMRGGVEPVKLTLALYAFPALVALFFKRDGRLHLP